ncbi:MAG: PRC-barrel domain-containing protein [Firmicutes bacterium]|nr:PRC-barrel domain-containing protein [Bacillota bacterium]
MKKTQQILGLPVIEISSGNQLGAVAGIIVNPDQGNVESLLLDRENWYGEMRALPFGSVQGVGEFAVTVMNSGDIFPVSKRSELVAILDKNIQVVKSGVMSRSGKFIGTVSEYVVDSQSGKIRGCEVVTEDGREFVVPGEKVLTFGSKFLVIEDGYEGYVVKELSGAVPAGLPGSKPVQPPAQPAARAKNQVPSDPVEIFEARQRQYLAGKKATRKISGAGGQVIVEQGAVITEEIIEKALAADKYIELTMNVDD